MKKKYFLFFVIISVLVSACQSQVNLQNSKKQLGEEISPGSLIASCSVVKYHKANNYFIVDVVIKEVKGYGPDTKVIAIGSEVKVKVNKELFTKEIFENGKTVLVELNQEEAGENSGIDLPPSNIWNCIKVISQ